MFDCGGHCKRKEYQSNLFGLGSFEVFSQSRYSIYRRLMHPPAIPRTFVHPLDRSLPIITSSSHHIVTKKPKAAFESTLFPTTIYKLIHKDPYPPPRPPTPAPRPPHPHQPYTHPHPHSRFPRHDSATPRSVHPQAPPSPPLRP